MRARCQIQWIDANGRPTPDTNPAIGEVWMPRRVYQRQDGTGVVIEDQRHWGICAEHARQLSEPGMEIWSFRSYPSQQLRKRFRWHLANPSGGCEVGKAAVIALARAKAELWAIDHEVTIRWTRDYDGWCVIAYNGDRIFAALGGYETEGGRAEEADVLVEAMTS